MNETTPEKQNMPAKTKILIGVLVVGIVLVAGWWVWESQTVKSPVGVCGPAVKGSNYDISYCDRSCNLDNDCQYTCGCGAINKNETCHDEGIIYDCVDNEVKCEKDKCVVRGEILPTGVTIATDKTEYEDGEIVDVTIKNNFSDTKYIDYPTVEKMENSSLVPLSGGIIWPGCYVTGGMPYLPLEPGAISSYQWDQKEKWCSPDPKNLNTFSKEVSSGKYRIKSRIINRTKSEAEDPNNISGLPDKEFFYSNEFTIKEKAAVSGDICDVGKGDWGGGIVGIFTEDNPDLAVLKSRCETKVDCVWKGLGGKIKSHFACCPKDWSTIEPEDWKIYGRCGIKID